MQSNTALAKYIDEELVENDYSNEEDFAEYLVKLTEYWDCMQRGEDCVEPKPNTKYHKELERKEVQRLQSEINSKKVYDPGEKKQITLGQFEKKYGNELRRKAHRALDKSNGRYDKETYAEIMRIHNEKNSDTEKKVKDSTNKTPTPKPQETQSQFNKINFNILDNPEYLKAYASKQLVYERIKRFIVRGEQKGDKLELYKKYYQKGKLVSCLSQRRLSNEFSISVNTIGKYLEKLQEDGVIKVHIVPAKEAWDRRKHHIYEFGTHTNGADERYYMDEKYGLA